MNSIKRWAFFVCSLLLILLAPAFRAHASTSVDSDITTNTHWTIDNSPYVISLPVIVNSGATLTIDPGVIVKFDVAGSLIVDGSIKSLGTPTAPIYFTSLADDSVGGDTNGDGTATSPQVGDWGQIIIESPDAPSVFNNVIEHYSDGGLLIFNSPFSSDTFTSDEQLYLFTSNSSFKNLTTPDFQIFDNSVVTINGGSIISAERFPLKVFNGSSLSISNMHLHSDSDVIVGVFDAGSSLALDTVTVDGDPNSTSGIDIFGTKFTAKNLTLINLSRAINVYDDGGAGGLATITDSSITCSQDGIAVYGSPSDVPNSSAIISGGNISCTNNGIVAYEGTASVTKTQISNSGTGIAGYDSNVSGSNNSIHDNATGALNIDDSVGNLNLTNNYWGDPSGPQNPTTNVNGLGNPVSDNISYYPWLTKWPADEVICCSNVLFLPGIEGSRLYKKGSIFNPTDQLWEPEFNSDVQDLYMDKNGKSINKVYTSDIIGTTNYNIPGFQDQQFYQAFINQMNSMVSNKTINDWKPFAYDWRLKLENIVNTPTILPNTTADLIKTIETEAKNSKTGKVTIITHSNGGLVAKVLINALVAKGEQNLIDNVIMVAAPQLGTPTSVPSLLHGDGETLAEGFALNATVGRKFGENAPFAYNLLPSSKYFSTVTTPVINFDSSIGNYGGWIKMYGNSINTMASFVSFITGGDGRKKPIDSDTNTPNILNGGLLADSIATHRVIDAWVPPSNITLYQVAGWDVDTVSSLTYTQPHFFSMTPSRVPLGKNDGDGTVLMSSATATIAPNVYNDYVDLGKYGNSKNISFNHGNIFQAQPVEDLIKNILNGNPTISPYVSSTKPTNIHGFVTIEMHSPVDINLYDAQGNHTGPAANPIPGSDLTYVEQNIPGSTYTAYGEDKYITVDANQQYTLDLQGTDQGTFTLQIADNTDSTNPTITSFADVPTSDTMKGEMTVDPTNQDEPTLAIDDNGDGVVDSTLTPNEPFDPALYFDLLRTTIKSLNLKPQVQKDLLAKVDKVQKQLTKGKIKQVTKELTNFVNKLDLGKGKLKNISDADRQTLVDSLNTLLDNLN